MKKLVVLTFAAFCSNAFAGSFIPTMALVVNEKGNEKKIDPSKFGYIGLTYTTEYNGVARMDLKEVSTGDKVRIWMNPELENSVSFSIGPFVVAEKKMAKDTISKLTIVQQLPPGNYITSYFYLSAKTSGISLKPDTLHVEVGKILSLGRINSQIELVPFIQSLKLFRVWTELPIPDSLYTPFGAMGISTTNLSHKTINLIKD